MDKFGKEPKMGFFGKRWEPKWDLWERDLWERERERDLWEREQPDGEGFWNWFQGLGSGASGFTALSGPKLKEPKLNTGKEGKGGDNGKGGRQWRGRGGKGWGEREGDDGGGAPFL